MDAIFPPDANPPRGHYSPAIRHDGVVYVSGQLPMRPTGEKVTGPVEAQMRQALANLDAILEAAGTSKDRVLKVTVYVIDVSLWDAVNKVYAEYFGDHRPARAIVPSGALHHGFAVELDAIAAMPEA